MKYIIHVYEVVSRADATIEADSPEEMHEKYEEIKDSLVFSTEGLDEEMPTRKLLTWVVPENES